MNIGQSSQRSRNVATSSLRTEILIPAFAASSATSCAISIMPGNAPSVTSSTWVPSAPASATSCFAFARSCVRCGTFGGSHEEFLPMKSFATVA